MKAKILNILDVARLACCLTGEQGAENRIDFACSIDHDHRSVSEWSAIGKVNFFDSPVVLVGGFGGWVEAVSLIESNEENLAAIANAISLFLEFNDEVVGIDLSHAQIKWDRDPDLKGIVDLAEIYDVV